MNKKLPVIVVEGKTDIDTVSKLIDAIFVSTNGSDVPCETISYLKELAKERQIIILTDPDYPGIQIRNKIAKEIPTALHAYVDRNKSSNGKKLGVAECQKDEILNALSHCINYDYSKEKLDYSISDLFELGLCGNDDSSKLRELVYSHFNLGYGNAKTLVKRLSFANVKKEDLINYLKEIKK